ncbi:N-acetyltransferase [Egicoccus sp. AB-alg2]|uniref:N-acetyltransferase n=1 Tax=Egicoccus sp. AB-alg2 TaxID=3242693 RepID=UPI00359DF5A0
MDVRVVSLAERPDLGDQLWAFSDGWPAFMLHDPVARLMDHLPERFPQLQLLAVDDQDRAVAKAHGLTFAWDGPPADLPARGWDAILERGMADHAEGRSPTAASALEISVLPHLRGTGLSVLMLGALRDAVAAMGLRDLFAPVRPNHKHLEPDTPMAEYAFRTRPDGLPHDPWLRVHVRAGADVVAVAPLSMTIPGTLAQWRSWTGLPLDRSGPTFVDGALSRVHVSVEHDHAVYVEPNVWVHHHV